MKDAGLFHVLSQSVHLLLSSPAQFNLEYNRIEFLCIKDIWTSAPRSDGLKDALGSWWHDIQRMASVSDCVIEGKGVLGVTVVEVFVGTYHKVTFSPTD